MRTFEHAVTLNEIHAFERNVEARIFGVLQEHELAAVSAGLDLAKSLELADAVVHVNYVVAGLQLGKIAEETRGANFAAGSVDRGRNVKKIGVTKKREPGVGKGDAFGEGRANEQHSGGFLRAFGGEAGSGIFGFAEYVGDFILAADVREAFDFSGARSGQENGSAGSELLDVNLRSFFERRRKLLFGPEVVGGRGGVGAAVTLVIFGCGREMFCCGFAQSLRLVEKHRSEEHTSELQSRL